MGNVKGPFYCHNMIRSQCRSLCKDKRTFRALLSLDPHYIHRRAHISVGCSVHFKMSTVDESFSVSLTHFYQTRVNVAFDIKVSKVCFSIWNPYSNLLRDKYDIMIYFVNSNEFRFINQLDVRCSFALILVELIPSHFPHVRKIYFILTWVGLIVNFG